MNKKLSTALAAVLLSACNKPAPAPVEPAVAPAATESAGPATDSAAVATATDPAAPAAAPADTAAAPQAAPAPAADAAGDQAINDSIDNLLGDHTQYQAAFAQLQQAVAAKDATAVAGMIDYPFTATIDGKKTAIKDATAFAAQYDRIVTPAIADVIVRQKYSELFVNYKGVMFGSGEAWLNSICKDKACKAFDVKVVAIQPGA